jgi:ketosteroid isomerase-like protein
VEFNLSDGGIHMQKRGWILLFLGLALAPLLPWAAAQSKDDQDLRALVPKIAHSWENMDFAKIDPYYAADSNLAFFDLAPRKYANWAEYRAGAQKGLFDPNRSLKVTLNDDLSVHHSGNLAWATFTWKGDIVGKQGAQSHLDARWTMILERRKGQWVVVHEHVSVPLPSA